jgi:branched-chain amino acid transport system permease protein
MVTGPQREGTMAKTSAPFTITAITIILLVLPFLGTSQYMLHMAILLFIYMVLAASWNLLGGYTGQLNLGHATFFGVGAYVSAMLHLEGIPDLIGIVLGGVASSIFGMIISPTFRLRGVYFAIGTLALTEAMRAVITNVNALGGASGLRLQDLQGYSKTHYYYIALVILIVSLITIYRVINSRMGMAFRAICGSESAAESLGVNPFLFKVSSLVISAFWAGVMGGFYSAYILYIEPNNAFSLFWTFNPVFAVILGGMGTFLGPIVGALVFVLISELTVGFGKMSSLIVGALLIGVIILVPRGIIGYISGTSKS